MAGVRIEFAQFGDFDYFEILRSDSPMDVESLPSPIVTSLTTMYYVDTTVVTGSDYYYRVVVWRDGVSQVSAEMMVTADVILWTPSLRVTALWLDAADASTITLTSGNVSQWNDKSGNARHASQSNTSLMPLYSAENKYIRATGAGETLNGTFSGVSAGTVNEYTLFMVLKPNKTASNSVTQSSSGAEFYTADYYNNVAFRASDPSNDSSAGAVSPYFSVTSDFFRVTETRNGIAPYNVSRATSLSAGTTLLIGMTRTAGGVINTRVFGVDEAGSTSAVSSLGWSNFAIFAAYTASSRFNGDINELVLVHDGDLDLSDLEKIEGYLAHKWEIAANLPSDHPYKTLPPTNV